MPRKQLIAGILTLVIAGVLLWTGRRGGLPQSAPGQDSTESSRFRDEPALAAEAILRDTLDAARNGDVVAYLSSFAGAIRHRLDQNVEERGRAAFANDLKQAARARKGHAIFAPEPDGPDAYVITVESIYPDRNERQAYRLERSSGSWRITAVETARGRTPSNKYGEPAEYQAPEDVPVATEEVTAPPASQENP
jgi:hypothetical protein